VDHVPETVYLIHLDEPCKHGRHYLGWASNLDARLAHHADGTGANLQRVAKDAGIGWTLARTWQGDRFRERQLGVTTDPLGKTAWSTLDAPSGPHRGARQAEAEAGA